MESPPEPMAFPPPENLSWTEVYPLLKIKRVEMQGFKSFCDRTEMRFHGSGIAAVVGPNGCGKSNLSDAINWVLGEQSPKACAAPGWRT